MKLALMSSKGNKQISVFQCKYVLQMAMIGADISPYIGGKHKTSFCMISFAMNTISTHTHTLSEVLTAMMSQILPYS